MWMNGACAFVPEGEFCLYHPCKGACASLHRVSWAGGLKQTGAAGACGFLRVLFVVFFGAETRRSGAVSRCPATMQKSTMQSAALILHLRYWTFLDGALNQLAKVNLGSCSQFSRYHLMVCRRFCAAQPRSGTPRDGQVSWLQSRRTSSSLCGRCART